MTYPTYLLLIITLAITTAYSSSSHAANQATVFSITGKPLFDAEGVKVSTITRGFASNQPVYKATVQKVQKGLLAKVFKKSLGFTPYGVAALAAYDLYGIFTEDDVILKKGASIDYSNYQSDGVGTCSYYGNSSVTYFDVTFEYCFARATSASGFIRDITKTNLSGGRMQFKGKQVPNYNFSWTGVSSIEPSVESTPVTDDELVNAMQQYISDNPNLDHSKMFYGADGLVDPEYFPNPEFQLNTATEQANADLYGAGLLQQTDPLADNYASPSDYAKAQELWEKQNLTPEQQADALNEQLKQPITQDQYATEQALKEARTETKLNQSAALLKALDIKPNDYTTASQENLDKTLELLNTTSDLPSSDFNNYLNFTTSETCKTVPFPFIGQFPNASQCQKLGTVKEFLGYFLSILLMWNIINTVLKEAN